MVTRRVWLQLHTVVVSGLMLLASVGCGPAADNLWRDAWPAEPASGGGPLLGSFQAEKSPNACDDAGGHCGLALVDFTCGGELQQFDSVCGLAKCCAYWADPFAGLAALRDAGEGGAPDGGTSMVSDAESDVIPAD